ncbi:MAG: dUTP diphosphatase [bacterium]
MGINKIQVERISPTAKLPTRGHANDAGLDFYSNEETLLLQGENKAIGTGIKIAIPDGYVALVWDKGGIARAGIHTMAGVIDAGYRGEVVIEIINLSKDSYKIKPGQKIAQILIQEVSLPEIEETKIDDQTTRGAGKHGSTGLY